MDKFFPFVTAASVAECLGCKGEKEKLKLTTTNSDVPPHILICNHFLPMGPVLSLSLMPKFFHTCERKGSGVLSSVSCHTGWGITLQIESLNPITDNYNVN